MTDKRNPADKPTGGDHVETDPSVEQVKGDVEEKAAKEQEQGFVGTKVDPRPDSAYTLESGPDSPPATDDDRDDRTRTDQRHV